MQISELEERLKVANEDKERLKVEGRKMKAHSKVCVLSASSFSFFEGGWPRAWVQALGFVGASCVLCALIAWLAAKKRDTRGKLILAGAAVVRVPRGGTQSGVLGLRGHSIRLKRERKKACGVFVY